MKKITTWVLLLLIPVMVSAQTFPVNNLVVNGTSSFTGIMSGAGVTALLAPYATTASPTFTGVPSGPTASLGTNTTQLATTAFVLAQVASSGVSTFNTRTGAVTLTSGDVTAALGYTPVTPSTLATYAPLASPGLTGVPTAPTASPGTSTTQLATTNFVTSAVAASTSAGVRFSGSGYGFASSSALTSGQMGAWGLFQTSGITITMPVSSSVVAGQTFSFLAPDGSGFIAAASGDSICSYKTNGCIGSAGSIQIFEGENIQLAYNGGGQWYVTGDSLNGQVKDLNVSLQPPDIGGAQNPVFYTTIESDTVNSGGGFLLGNESRLLFGSSGSQGGRIAQYDYLQQNAVTSASSTNRNYVGTQSEITTGTGDGGTDLHSNAKGGYYAYAADARANTGATNMFELTGGEIDTDTQTGSSMGYLIGWSVVGNNSVQGTNLDAAIDIGGGNQSGTGNHVGWNFGLVFDDIHGNSPFNGSSTVIGGSFPSLGTQTVLYGVNMTAFNCSAACFASNGFSVLQNGTINTVGINGVTNGAAAASGTVGQQLSNNTASVGLSSGVTVNGTSISLGAGQYNVQCTAQFSGGGTINFIEVGVNTSSAVMPGYSGLTLISAPLNSGGSNVITSPMIYENLSSTTTVFCPVASGFGTSMTANTTVTVLRVH
jgi:hypothetical protein